jgi:hypothetical protein
MTARSPRPGTAASATAEGLRAGFRNGNTAPDQPEHAPVDHQQRAADHQRIESSASSDQSRASILVSLDVICGQAFRDQADAYGQGRTLATRFLK